jgi:predicted nucleic acid-binding protein
VICGAICVASEQVLQLATSSRCSAYDCEFVAAAQQLGCRW